MREKTIVNAVVNALIYRGFKYVATEVANFYRSVDIGAIDNEGNIWAIECKVSNIGRAIEQSKTHKLSADKVFIATFRKNTREDTLNRIREAGIGLFYVSADGLISELVEEPKQNKPWSLARDRFVARIMEGD